MARKILLADDSVTAQNMGRKILTDAGYEVVTVNNGSAALKKIHEEKPALIVLDVYMPGYSGLEVCQRVKDAKDTAETPVLLTVGKLEPFKQDDARRVQADAFIIKPFEATELLAALNKLEAKLGPANPTRPEPVKSEKEIAKADSTKSEAPKQDSGKKSRGTVATMQRYERLVADGAPQFGDNDSGWKARLPQPTPRAHDDDSETDPVNQEYTLRQAHHETAQAETAEFASAALPQDVTPAELAAIAAAAAAVGQNAAVSQQATSASADSSLAIVEPVSSIYAVETESTAHVEPAPASVDIPAASMSVAEPVAVAAPSRWVAHEVPLEPRESELVLEREMQKAFAAFAAAERSGGYEPGPGAGNNEPVFATMAPVPVGDPVPFGEGKVSEPEPSAAEKTRATVMASSSSVSPELPKPPAVIFTPPSVPLEESKHAISAFGEPHPFGVSQVEESQPEEKQPEKIEVESFQPVNLSAESPQPSAVSEKPATWADWHDIREAEAQSPRSDSESQSRNEDNSLKPETESNVEAAMAAAASANSSNGSDPNLSSIVDSMLAELKPKLMAELARKLEKK